jgi:hypothetical protein
MKFSSLGPKFKLKFKLSRNFELQSFELTRFYFSKVVSYNVTDGYVCFSLWWDRVDGGVSRNDFVDQLVADLTGLKVERPKSSEMTVLGAAFLAGLHKGN